MDSEATKAPVFLAVIIVGAWVGLAVFNVLALIAFGGWVGAADGFIPWSVAAALLWHFSHARLGLPALRTTWTGRVILVLWLIFLALAAAGIDERAWAPRSSVVVWTYLALPFVPAFFLTGALLWRAFGKGRRLTSA